MKDKTFFAYFGFYPRNDAGKKSMVHFCRRFPADKFNHVCQFRPFSMPSTPASSLITANPRVGRS